MHPRKFIRDSIGIAVSQYIVRALLMARGVIAARLLGPYAFGAWSGLSLILDYGLLAPMGSQQGLDQLVPGRIVAGDRPSLTRLKRAGLFNILLLNGLFAALCLSYFGFSTGQLRTFWGLHGIAAMLACAILTCIASYHLTLLRSHGDAGALSVWSLIQGMTGALLGLALLPFIGAWGLLIGWLVGTVAALFYVRAQGRAVVPLSPAPARESLTLIAVGVPMFLFSITNLVMRTLDRLVILRFLGAEALGYYSLGVVALTLMLYLPDSVSYVLYPRLLRKYHQAGDRPEALHGDFERTTRTLALVVPVLCGIVYLAADDVVGWVLPQFLHGLVPLKVLGFGAVGLALANLSSITVMTLGRRLWLLPAALLMAGLSAVLDLTAALHGFGIAGVAWATTLAYSVAGAVLLWLAGTGLRLGFGRRVLDLLTGFAPLALSIGLAFFMDYVLPWPDAVGGGRAFLRLAFGIPIYVVIYGLAAYPMARGLGLRQLAAELNLPGASLLRRPGDVAAPRDEDA